MTEEQILEQIRPYIAEKLDVDPSKVELKADFEKDLGADSLDRVEMLMKLEKGFNLDIPDAKQSEIRTVGDVIRIIREMSAPETKKFVIIQNFTYNRYTPDYSGRPTQINVGAVTKNFQKQFIELMRNCKPVDGNRFYCGFDVYYDDNTAFEVKPDRLHPAVEWEPGSSVNKAEKDEMVIVMNPCVSRDTDCVATSWHDCPLCIASGKCPSPFIRKYIGRIFFPNQYGKER